MSELTYTIEYIPQWAGLLFGLSIAAVCVLIGLIYIVKLRNRKVKNKPNGFYVMLAIVVFFCFVTIFTLTNPPEFIGNVVTSSTEKVLTVEEIPSSQVFVVDGVPTTTKEDSLLVCQNGRECKPYAKETTDLEIAKDFTADHTIKYGNVLNITVAD